MTWGAPLLPLLPLPSLTARPLPEYVNMQVTQLRRHATQAATSASTAMSALEAASGSTDCLLARAPKVPCWHLEYASPDSN